MTDPSMSRLHATAVRQRWRTSMIRAASVTVCAAGALALSRRAHLGDELVNARIFVVTLGAVALAVLVGVLRDQTAGRPSRPTTRGTLFDVLARPEPVVPAGRPAELEHARDSITFALNSARGRDRWLRGDVSVIVEARIGVADLSAGSEDTTRLAARLAPETWELIRPDRSIDRTGGPGLSVATMQRILDDLERL